MVEAVWVDNFLDCACVFQRGVSGRHMSIWSFGGDFGKEIYELLFRSERSARPYTLSGTVRLFVPAFYSTSKEWRQVGQFLLLYIFRLGPTIEDDGTAAWYGDREQNTW